MLVNNPTMVLSIFYFLARATFAAGFDRLNEGKRNSIISCRDFLRWCVQHAVPQSAGYWKGNLAFREYWIFI